MAEQTSTSLSPLLRYAAMFWSWWVGELAALLPEQLRQRFVGGQRLLLRLRDSVVELTRVSAQGRETLGSYPVPLPGDAVAGPLPDPGSLRETLLCLPMDRVLAKTVTLPAAAEENLREVLGFEMDRQTPFTVEQVYYDFGVVARDRDKHTIDVRLIVVPRTRLDNLLDGLEVLGLRPSLVTVDGEPKRGAAAVNLLPASRRRRKKDLVRRVNALLGALALMLLGVAVALPIWQKRQLIETLQPQLQQLAQQAEATRKLREQIDRASLESRFLAEKKQSSLLVLEVLDELTRLLPDDTWIYHLELRRDELQIRGQSTSSATLIPIVESSPILHNARFRSPVTQNRNSDAERFHLSAEVKREAAP